MIKLLLFLLLTLPPQDFQYKLKEEFEIKLDYQFKQRPREISESFNPDGSRKVVSNAILPYLIIDINILKLAGGEVKVKISNNKSSNTTTRKISEGAQLSIDLGFTDDVKDRLTSHEYVVSFLSPEKREVNRIVIFIEEDGTFLVNGEKRGKL